jgi:superfamily II DNA or RNA helicase
MNTNDRVISHDREIKGRIRAYNSIAPAMSSLAAVEARLAETAALPISQQTHKRRKELNGGLCVPRPFQSPIIKEVIDGLTGSYSLEAGCGCGKTYVAAFSAVHFAARGKKIIYICPSIDAIGSESHGHIQVFHRVFNAEREKKKRLNKRMSLTPYPFGEVNEAAFENIVSFFTPRGFVRLKRRYPELMEALLDKCGFIVVDEAHHYAADSEDTAVIHGEIFPICQEFSHRGRVLTMTATHGRHDGGVVMGKLVPDRKVTTKYLIQQDETPEIYCRQLILHFDRPRIKRKGEDYSLSFESAEEWDKYFRMIAGCIVAVWDETEKPFCAFVHRVDEARAIAKCVNAASGKDVCAVLVGDAAPEERDSIISGIESGELRGFITCNVGEESLSIPRLEVAHLIRRTRSINKLVQSVGRVLRQADGKKRALVIDYMVAEESLIRSCCGLMDFAKYIDVQHPERIVNGGPLLTVAGEPGASPEYSTINGERELILAQVTSRVADIFADILISAAQQNYRKPTKSMDTGYLWCPETKAVKGTFQVGYAAPKERIILVSDADLLGALRKISKKGSETCYRIRDAQPSWILPKNLLPLWRDRDIAEDHIKKYGIVPKRFAKLVTPGSILYSKKIHETLLKEERRGQLV